MSHGIAAALKSPGVPNCRSARSVARAPVVAIVMRTLRWSGCPRRAVVALGVTARRLDPFIADRAEVGVVNVAIQQVTKATLMNSHGENVMVRALRAADRLGRTACGKRPHRARCACGDAGGHRSRSSHSQGGGLHRARRLRTAGGGVRLRCERRCLRRFDRAGGTHFCIRRRPNHRGACDFDPSVSRRELWWFAHPWRTSPDDARNTLRRLLPRQAERSRLGRQRSWKRFDDRLDAAGLACMGRDRRAVSARPSSSHPTAPRSRQASTTCQSRTSQSMAFLRTFDFANEAIRLARNCRSARTYRFRVTNSRSSLQVWKRAAHSRIVKQRTRRTGACARHRSESRSPSASAPTATSKSFSTERPQRASPALSSTPRPTSGSA